jgi:hypothetical protein
MFIPHWRLTVVSSTKREEEEEEKAVKKKDRETKTRERLWPRKDRKFS